MGGSACSPHSKVRGPLSCRRSAMRIPRARRAGRPICSTTACGAQTVPRARSRIRSSTTLPIGVRCCCPSATALRAAFDPSEETLWPLLWAQGHRAAFASDARILHLNVGRFSTLIHEKFCVGVVLGTRRSARWSPLRRLLYFVGSPLIPLVLFVRVLRGARHWPSGGCRRVRLPAC